MISVASEAGETLDLPERCIAALEMALPGVSIAIIDGFDDWPLYNNFFKAKLERGSPEYNALIGKFWPEVLEITQKLGDYIAEKGISLLYLVDVCAIPINVSLALAVVLVSEYLGIPVINQNRRFYWEMENHPFYTNRHLGEFFSQIDVLFPWEARSWMHLNATTGQSRRLIELNGHIPANVTEFNSEANIDDQAGVLDDILYRLHLQLEANSFDVAQRAVKDYSQLCNFSNEDLRAILPIKNRHYLPGYGRVGFMLFLKSLIDPSYFRVEEQRTRGMMMYFAHALVEENATSTSLPVERLHRFYNAVDNLFLYRDGEESIRHDHSLAYRHRNTLHYPYRDFTHQELMGLVNMLFHQIIGHTDFPENSLAGQVVDLSVVSANQGQISNPSAAPPREPRRERDERLRPGLFYILAIDDRTWLVKKLQENRPIAYFPGEFNREMLGWLLAQPIRKRLGLADNEAITRARLAQLDVDFASIYIFCPQSPGRKRITADMLRRYIADEADPELRVLFECNLCKIVETEQWSVGIHFPQLGVEALQALRVVKEQNGILINDNQNAAMMSDIVDIDRFHIGQADHPLTTKIMGIPMGSRYVQFVPAGLRPTLAYPTPVQTAKDFSDALHSPHFERLCQQYGEAAVLQRLKADAESRGSPVQHTLERFDDEGESATRDSLVTTQHLCGVYQDGHPWSGVVARAGGRTWRFSILAGGGKTKTAPEFVQAFSRETGLLPAIAWNGGYILNAELVGKLGLPEAYIASPLGLIISDGQVICPPLFNKPAFLVYANGRLDIQRVSCDGGLRITDAHHRFTLDSANRNPKKPHPDEICFYDLMHDEETIEGNGRIVVRLAGNVIKEIIHTAPKQSAPIIPVGLTLSFPAHQFPAGWDQVDKSLRIEMMGWDEIVHAIEAGPLLVEGGKNAIAMDVEGWTRQNSIRTQAARMDYTNMRGPKIAIGLDSVGNLSVLAVNGRIRESVGATHVDMAEILLSLGAQKGMGFDPGGSSTLVVEGKTVNISPYNADYEKDVYALPPEPRAVASAVVGYLSR